MIKLGLFKVLLFVAMSPILGQKKDTSLYECFHPNESIKINNLKANEKFDRKAARFFGFEQRFKDTVSIFVEDKIIYKKYVETNEDGRADRVKFYAKKKSIVTIRTSEGDYTQFCLKGKYKYIYIQRYKANQWNMVYSNFNRVYY